MGNNKIEIKNLVDVYDERFWDSSKARATSILDNLTDKGKDFFTALFALVEKKLGSIVGEYIGTLNKTKQNVAPSKLEYKLIFALKSDFEKKELGKKINEALFKTKKCVDFFQLENLDDKFKALEKLEKVEDVKNCAVVFDLINDSRFYSIFEKRVKEQSEEKNKELEKKLDDVKEELKGVKKTVKEHEKDLVKKIEKQSSNK